MPAWPPGSGRRRAKSPRDAPNRRGARRKSLSSPFTTRLYAALAGAYLRWVGKTSRIIWVNRVIREELEKAGKGYIYAFWHGRQVFLVYTHQNDRTHPLVSQSKDGELIARVCQSFGMFPVRGSTSRGGLEALLEMKTLLEKGEHVSFTPDGPRGPVCTVQPGVLYLAQKTGCPIVPMAYGPKRRWIIKGGWDNFVVPKPFNRISMIYGEPITVKPGDDLTKKADELKKALDWVTLEADSVAGVGCCES